jgi:serine/threonine protein kinase
MTDRHVDRDNLAEALPGYDVGVELGRGAFGVVVSGRHRQLGRDVAIQQLPAAFAADPAVRQRFASEARVLASLDHPHIVPIFDYVERDGLCALVMELLPGGSVRRLQAEGVTPQQAVAIALATCAALDFAHERGVLHRDIKPDNLLFTAGRMLKVIDFGIAKVVGASMATRVGETLGTPAYMAPEQCLGRPPGPGADIYATGVMLYELLAGRLPFFDDGDVLALLHRQVHETPPSLLAVAPDLPEGLALTVMRAMAKDPADRHLSAESFGVALAEAATGAWGVGWLKAAGLKVMALGPIHAATERPSMPPFQALVLPAADDPTGPMAAQTVMAKVSDIPSVPPADQRPLRPQRDSVISRISQRRSTKKPSESVADRPTGQQATVLSGPEAGAVETERPPSRSRRLVAIGAVVVVLAGSATALITKLATSASAHPVTAYAFSPESYSSGLVVDRLWTLSGASGSQLHSTVTVTDGSGTPIHGSYTEVLPTSVASTVTKVDFDPAPAQVIQVDPVVRYDVGLESEKSFTFTYSADIGKTSGSWFARLTQLAASQTASQTAYLESKGEKIPATLAALSISKTSLVLSRGQKISVQLSGRMSNGTPALPAAFESVAWTSASSKVASVDNGVIMGTGPGTTTITAQAGFLTASVDVKVSGSPTSTSSSLPSTGTSTTSTTTPGSTTTITVPGSKPRHGVTTTTGAPSAAPPGSTSPVTPTVTTAPTTVTTATSTTTTSSTTTTTVPITTTSSTSTTSTSTTSTSTTSTSTSTSTTTSTTTPPTTSTPPTS